MTYCNAFKDGEGQEKIEYKTVTDMFSMPLSAQSIYSLSWSKVLSQVFPTINYKNKTRLDKKYLKQIGVVVLQAYCDTANSSKIGFKVIESFIGSLDKDATDETTNKKIFIDDIVN